MKMIPPVEAEPSDRVAYRVYIFLLFFFRIGVVQAQVAYTAIIPCETEVEANAFRMADMQVAVGFGRETGFDAPPPFAAPVVLFNDAADEVGSGGRGGARINVICQISLSNFQCPSL